MFQLSHIIGMFILAVIAGLSSLVGLGGGASSIIVLMFLFDILPKEAIIIVYACIFGSSCGSMIDKMQISHDGKPIINYRQVFISLPLIFIGALIGVHLNVLLPSIFTIGAIMSVTLYNSPKILIRFKAAYKL